MHDYRHQDWDTVVLKKKPASSSAGGGGPNTQISESAAKMAKLDRDTEQLSHARISSDSSRLIVQTRCAKKMNRQDLAKRCNLPVKVIEDYETGRAIPDGKVLAKLSRALGVTVKK